MSNITITPVQQTVYRIKSERGDFAEITIGTFDGTKGFSLSIRSSFGSYGHYWGAPGDETPLEFLRTCHDGYLMGKLETHQEFYPEETIKSLKSEIIRLRKDMTFDANEAREIWDSIEYTDDAKEFGDNLKGLWEYEWYELFVYGHPRQLVGFFKYIFRPFLDRIKAQPTQPAPVSQSEFQQDLNQLWSEADESVSVLVLSEAVMQFIDKYRNTQPAPGRFVPESEIEKLSIAVDGGYLSDLPFIIRDFLKAIDNEKGGQTS